MPDVKMVPIDAYHWPLTERPVEVREAIESWCAELKPVFLTGCCSEGVYDSRDGGGRVASGTATELLGRTPYGKDCSDVHGCTNAAGAWMRRSGLQSSCISSIHEGQMWEVRLQGCRS